MSATMNVDLEHIGNMALLFLNSDPSPRILAKEAIRLHNLAEKADPESDAEQFALIDAMTIFGAIAACCTLIERGETAGLGERDLGGCVAGLLGMASRLAGESAEAGA